MLPRLAAVAFALMCLAGAGVHASPASADQSPIVAADAPAPAMTADHVMTTEGPIITLDAR
jgi:hypothetical protein